MMTRDQIYRRATKLRWLTGIATGFCAGSVPFLIYLHAWIPLVVFIGCGVVNYQMWVMNCRLQSRQAAQVEAAIRRELQIENAKVPVSASEPQNAETAAKRSER